MKKHQCFFELNRKEKNKQYINIKNKIGSRKGRIFYTDHYMDDDEYTVDPNNPYDIHPRSQKSTWLDLYFLSKKHRFFYNACFITRDMAALDAIEDYIKIEAEKRCTKAAPPPNEWFQGGACFKRNEKYSDYFFELDTNEEKVRQEVFTHTINVQSDVRMDFKYACGVGLYITVDTDDLTTEVVNNTIIDFWNAGETITNGKIITYMGDDIHKLFTREYFQKKQP